MNTPSLGNGSRKNKSDNNSLPKERDQVMVFLVLLINHSNLFWIANE